MAVGVKNSSQMERTNHAELSSFPGKFMLSCEGLGEGTAEPPTEHGA